MYSPFSSTWCTVVSCRGIPPRWPSTLTETPSPSFLSLPNRHYETESPPGYVEKLCLGDGSPTNDQLVTRTNLNLVSPYPPPPPLIQRLDFFLSCVTVLSGPGPRLLRTLLLTAGNADTSLPLLHDPPCGAVVEPFIQGSWGDIHLRLHTPGPVGGSLTYLH